MQPHVARICLIVLVSSLLAGLAEAKPKLYFELRSVKEPAGTKPSLKKQAGTLLMKQLESDARVTTKLGDPPPKGAELVKILKSKKIPGYALELRITKANHAVHPPQPGKVYKVLMVEVNVAIDAEKIPSGQMALAGQGTAQVGTEISRFKEKERAQLLREALVEAVKQAAQRTLDKMTASKKKHRRRGRRRRSR